MWRALRAELAYFRPWLLGGLGIAAGIGILMSVLVRFAADEEDPPVFVVALLTIIAGMVVSFIAQSYRSEEHRDRLLLSGPLTPRQLAAVLVLLPVCLVGLAGLAGLPLIALAALITGTTELSGLETIAPVGVQFLAYAMLGPLAQESSAARRQGRSGAAISGWAIFFGVIALLAVSGLLFTSVWRHLLPLVAVAATMVFAATLYLGRRDFSR